MFFSFENSVYICTQLNTTNMKDLKLMFDTIKEAAKEDPKEVILSVIVMTSLFALLWAGLWLAAILEGNV